MASEFTTETLTDPYSDDSEGLYGFKWQHFDLILSMRGDAAISGAKATDFRHRAAYQQREALLHEMAMLLLPLMGPSEKTGRAAGEEYLAWEREQATPHQGGDRDGE